MLCSFTLLLCLLNLLIIENALASPLKFKSSTNLISDKIYSHKIPDGKVEDGGYIGAGDGRIQNNIDDSKNLHLRDDRVNKVENEKHKNLLYGLKDSNVAKLSNDKNMDQKEFKSFNKMDRNMINPYESKKSQANEKFVDSFIEKNSILKNDDSIINLEKDRSLLITNNYKIDSNQNISDKVLYFKKDKSLNVKLLRSNKDKSPDKLYIQKGINRKKNKSNNSLKFKKKIEQENQVLPPILKKNDEKSEEKAIEGVPSQLESSIKKSNVDQMAEKEEEKLLKNFKEVKPMKMDELQPPDHMDGVRMEQDGHLNRDYKKEILLGNHEEFEFKIGKSMNIHLQAVFKKADIDNNSYLDLQELQNWIILKVQEHLHETVNDYDRIFNHLDADKDGFITWKEFNLHFLLAKGYSLEKAVKILNEENEAPALDPEDKERLVRYKFRWADADDMPSDDRLSVDEFRNFRHPEQSKIMILRVAKDILENLDQDENEIISEEEFISSPSRHMEQMVKETDQIWRNERQKEFREVVDLNHDGFVDIKELQEYVDPNNINHAKLEAENLMRLGDEDRDGQLSLTEVLDNAELFFGSKMVDASLNFHDEF